MKSIAQIDPAVLAVVRQGTVIPAMPLALNAQRQFQPRYQRALCRYYIAPSGASPVGCIPPNSKSASRNRIV